MDSELIKLTKHFHKKNDKHRVISDFNGMCF